MRGYLAIALVCLLYGTIVDGFYLPGSYNHAYQESEELMVKVNSLTSVDTQLPFGHYTLPFCKPDEGEKHEGENIGQLLMGDSIENSPYKFKTNVNESTVVLCAGPALDEHQVKLFQQRIDDFYQINLILDNLPVTRYIKARDSHAKLRWAGFPIGFSYSDKFRSSDKYYIYNHLKFTVLLHDYDEVGVGMVMDTGDGTDLPVATDESGNKKGGLLVVGFEVAHCSVPHLFKGNEDPKPKSKIAPVVCEEGRYQEISVGQKILYSYDVKFLKSESRWPSRWNAFLKVEQASVHWFSILNSLMVIAFLAGIVFVVFLTVRRDLTRYEELGQEAQAQTAEELSGWKLVAGDVFRAPNHTALLCIMVGDGVQITGMAVVTILLAALGFMSPASRGMLLRGMVLLYLFLGIAAGYAASRLWRTLKRDPKGWRGVSWGVACFFPGIAVAILTVLNSLLWAKGSTGAIPVSLFFILLALWFCISVPLTLLGGFLGARAEQISYPVRTNQISREIPPQKYSSWLLVLLVLGTGLLPFSPLYIELFFIMSSIWWGRVYYEFGFLFLALVLLVIVLAGVSVVLTYRHLRKEDWAWWWKSFFASGSVGFYVFLYAMNYLIFHLRLRGTVSVVLYIGYATLMALAIMLATGTIGFLVSFYFVHYLYSSVKLTKMDR